MEIYIGVKNFGKIKEATINISNFTIFVGNNNSGKTQLMELIYTIINQIPKIKFNIDIPKISNIEAFRVGKKEVLLLNKCINDYLKCNINKIIEETFNNLIPIEEISLEFKHIDVNYEIYFLKGKETIEYVLNEKLISQEQLIEMFSDLDDYYGSFIIQKNEESKNIVLFPNDISIEVVLQFQLRYIVNNILIGKFLQRSPNILFLPASRMGLMLLYKHYFGNNEVSKMRMINEKNLNSKSIPKPVLDFLLFLLKYNYTERMAKNNQDIINFIQENLTEGTISEKDEVTVYTPNDCENEIPINIASSMVNEVVPLIKALTDSNEIDYIFYDEVETSMHPLKQIEMAKLLNRLNNKGIKLLISTHSDTMATKINNLLLLSYGNLDFRTTKQMLEKNGILISKEDLLLSNNIHVYQFINNKYGKSEVQELKFTKVPSIGYDFSLFNDSTMNLFEEAKIVMGMHDEN